jgi:hypothetical protein
MQVVAHRWCNRRDAEDFGTTDLLTDLRRLLDDDETEHDRAALNTLLRGLKHPL